MEQNNKDYYRHLAYQLAQKLYRHEFYKTKDAAEFQFWCPNTLTKHVKQHKPKLSVNFKKNTFNCWVCDYSGTARKILHDHQISFDASKMDWEKQVINYDTNVELPPYDQIVGDVGEIHKIAYAYVKSRLNCTDKFIKEFEIGYYNYLDNGNVTATVLVPSYNKMLKPNFYFLHGIFNKSFKKNSDKKLGVVMFESKIDFNNKNLVLVEGPFDSLKLWTYGIQNTPLFGSSLSEDSLIYNYIKTYNINVTLFLDKDVSFSKINGMLEKLTSDNIVAKAFYPYNNFSFTDPAEMPASDVLINALKG